MVTRGDFVNFFPSERRQSIFKNKKHESYPAMVVDVNDESVDLKVFGVKEEVYVSNVKEKDSAQSNHSYYERK